MVFKVGDAVRLKASSSLRELLEPWAEAVGRVRDVYDQVDDDDGLRIAVAFSSPSEAYTSLLPADDFEPDPARADPS